MVFLYSLDCPRTLYVEQINFKDNYPPASTSQVLDLWAWNTMSQ